MTGMLWLTFFPPNWEKNIREFLPSSFRSFLAFTKAKTTPSTDIATANTTCDMEHRGKKSGGDRKNGARAVAAGKKSNTKAKQGSQRGGRAGYLVTTRLSIFNI
jgi:hypothetical protein